MYLHYTQFQEKRMGDSVLSTGNGLAKAAPGMEKVLQSLAKTGLRDRVKVMVGGAPVKERSAQEIGVDGYGPDAIAAGELAKGLTCVPGFSKCASAGLNAAPAP